MNCSWSSTLRVARVDASKPGRPKTCRAPRASKSPRRQRYTDKGRGGVQGACGGPRQRGGWAAGARPIRMQNEPQPYDEAKSGPYNSCAAQGSWLGPPPLPCVERRSELRRCARAHTRRHRLAAGPTWLAAVASSFNNGGSCALAVRGDGKA